MLRCPFCDAIESERFVLENRQFIVFPCLFTAEVSVSAAEAEIEADLKTRYRDSGENFFRKSCDELHRFVTRPDVARRLTGRAAS